MQEISFWVGVCLGRGDGGNVMVDIEITDDEYEALVQCSRDDEDIDGCEAIFDLRARIVAAAETAAASYDEYSDIDYHTDVWYVVQMPDEIWEAAHRE